MPVGETFTIQLTDVRLLSPIMGSTPPRLLEGNIITVTVPEEAANSEVGCTVCFQMLVLNKITFFAYNCAGIDTCRHY